MSFRFRLDPVLRLRELRLQQALSELARRVAEETALRSAVEEREAALAIVSEALRRDQQNAIASDALQSRQNQLTVLGDELDRARSALRQSADRRALAQAEVAKRRSGEKALEQLRDDHRAALDGLVADGELDANVADEIQESFDEAAFHVWRANCGMTCYEPMPGPEYTLMASSQLVSQAELLEDLSDDATIDPDVVARAQAAVERDITFLNLSGEEEKALYDALIAAGAEELGLGSRQEAELRGVGSANHNQAGPLEPDNQLAVVVLYKSLQQL